MPTPPPDSPRWPELLLTRFEALHGATGHARQAARADFWQVLHAALFASLRAQAHRVPVASREDLEDLASSKSLELLARAEQGAWTPAGRPAHEIAGFVARVARNGLVDLGRRRGREVPGIDDDESWGNRVANGSHSVAPSPEERAAAAEFVAALRDCAGLLAPRSRTVWFHRVFLESASREIAAVCGVRAAHVDVLVQRARAALRTCMEAKGHAGAEPRPGVFAALWPEWVRTPIVPGAPEDEATDD